MNLLTTLLTIGLAPMALATPLQTRPSNGTTTGHALVSNDCPFPVFLWSVSSTVSGQATVNTGMTYSEVFRQDAHTGGVSIKITTQQDGLYTSAPQTIFAYNLVGEQVWYDLSDVFGDAFKGNWVSLGGVEAETITWEDGIPPAGSQVRVQSAKEDLVLKLC